MSKKFTVCLYPGAGYGLFPFEVEAENGEDALIEAVKRCLNEDFSIDGFKWTEEKAKEIMEYYKKERKKYYNDFEFLTEYLNYYYISELDFFLKMDNVRIQEGWNLYENNIEMKIKVWDLIQKEWESMEKETLMKFTLETLARLKENTTEADFEMECDLIYNNVTEGENL